MARGKPAPVAERFASRILRSELMRAGDLAPHPQNWRTHPAPQREALEDVVGRVGWVSGVIFNERTGHLIDGHLRVEMAGPDAMLPFQIVDLSEEEEALVLATLDPLASLAVPDPDALSALIDGLELPEALLDALTDIAGMAGQDWGSALARGADMPEPEMTEMVFSMTHEQKETVLAALSRARHAGPFLDGDNENRNGNALARIAEAYVG